MNSDSNSHSSPRAMLAYALVRTLVQVDAPLAIAPHSPKGTEARIIEVVAGTPSAPRPLAANYPGMATPAPVPAQQSRSVSQLFREYADEWYRDRPRGDVRVMCTHSAYQKILALGPAVVPHILQELRRTPEHWFTALFYLTGAKGVVPPESRGNLPEMAAAWVKWGKEHGLLLA